MIATYRNYETRNFFLGSSKVQHRKEPNFQGEELINFFENAPIGLHWVDAKGTIIWANKFELKLLGYSRDEYIGHNTAEFYVDPEVIKEILTRLKSDKTLSNYEVRLRAKDGAIKYVQISSNVYWEDGKFVHTRCFTQDITAKKELERRKDEFISMASHELKTPLTVIKGYTQILKTNLSDSKDVYSEYILKMEDQINRLNKLVIDLLDVSKIESGKLRLERKKFNLNQLVTEVVGEMQHTTEKHKIMIRGKVVKEILADKYKIGQVLVNLLSNAIKYSPKGDKIVVQLKGRGEDALVTVEDFGIGISKKDRSNVFERFFQAQNTIRQSFSGLGLGLYISAEIIRRHNGKIWMESEKGRGSKFFFTIPF
ncbi:MAG: PAS domain-containing sensor histidine kinase [Candidatus Daviesbacteria bacterium]|nr:PAS domain-containing sensor histidine kinase [Candidatus Daviesbacteria bacterium]